MSARRLPYRGWLLLCFLLLSMLSLVRAPANTVDLILHHIPTVLFLAWLCFADRTNPLDDLAYSLTFLFLLTHVLGARYLYSDVPWNEWLESLTGVDLNYAFGFRRNHYDRFVHFVFGLLMLRPARQILEHRIRGSLRAILFLAVGLIVLAGTVYELLEWLVAVAMSPETAENYNGQQGDVWDPHKDMAAALLGALLAVGLEVRARFASPPRRDVAKNVVESA